METAPKLRFSQVLRRDFLYELAQIAVLTTCLAWSRYDHLPAPGWAVAVIAVVAAIMSIHADMQAWQKCIWLLLIAALLSVELRAIAKDRWDASEQFKGDRKAQELSFQDVRTRQEQAFALTTKGLTDAIDGINATLETSNKTLIQTQPHAAVRFDHFGYAEAAPQKLLPDVQYFYNLSYINIGTVAATNVLVYGQIYTGYPDDAQSEHRLVARFEKEWAPQGLKKSSSIMVPNTPMFKTLPHTFTADEYHSQPPITIYYLFRIEYSDGTGRWRTDACGEFQLDHLGMYVNVTHFCSVFNRFRYRVSERAGASSAPSPQ